MAIVGWERAVARVAWVLLLGLGCAPRGSSTTECSRTADCPQGLVCLSGRCIEECVQDRECTTAPRVRCALDTSTNTHRCVDPSVSGVDAGPEASMEAGMEAGPEASTEASMEAGPEASAEAGPEGGADVVPDMVPTRDASAGPNVAGLGAGDSFSCAVLVTGSVRCWGSNSDGQLGAPGVAMSTTPVTVGSFNTATAVAAGGQHACVRLQNGTASCWGSNGFGQVGLPASMRVDAPTVVMGLANVASLAAGASHTCALHGPTGSRQVSCWGRNIDGELGRGTSGAPGPSPARVTLPAEPVQVAAGGHTTCARLADDSVYCWGANGQGQLSNGTSMASSSPVRITLLGGTASDVAVGADSVCLGHAGNNLECWGSNTHGQLGDGTITPRTTHSTIPFPLFLEARGSNLHYCARSSAGRVACWGANGLGQTGAGSPPMDLTSPATPPSLSMSNVSLVSGGGAHTCALLGANDLRCWGANTQGQLGDGTMMSRLLPVAVVGL